MRRLRFDLPAELRRAVAEKMMIGLKSVNIQDTVRNHLALNEGDP